MTHTPEGMQSLPQLTAHILYPSATLVHLGKIPDALTTWSRIFTVRFQFGFGTVISLRLRGAITTLRCTMSRRSARRILPQPQDRRLGFHRVEQRSHQNDGALLQLPNPNVASMKLDSTAAAYGLIQVVFADAAERLAYALFVLEQRRGAATSFEKIHHRKFRRILEAFEDELKQFDGERKVAADLNDVRDACSQLKTLSHWRNERIHALVRQVDDGFALYSLETRKRLSISYQECDDILHKLVDIAMTLGVCLPKLLNALDLNERLYAAIKERLSQADYE